MRLRRPPSFFGSGGGSTRGEDLGLGQLPVLLRLSEVGVGAQGHLEVAQRDVVGAVIEADATQEVTDARVGRVEGAGGVELGDRVLAVGAGVDAVHGPRTVGEVGGLLRRGLEGRVEGRQSSLVFVRGEGLSAVLEVGLTRERLTLLV